MKVTSKGAKSSGGWFKEHSGTWVCTRGKHKGESIHLIDKSYLDWILNNTNPSERDIELINNALNGTLKAKRSNSSKKPQDAVESDFVKGATHLSNKDLKHLIARIQRLEEQMEEIKSPFIEPGDYDMHNVGEDWNNHKKSDSHDVIKGDALSLSAQHILINTNYNTDEVDDIPF